MIIARKINERKQLEAKDEHRRLKVKAQYVHDVATGAAEQGGGARGLKSPPAPQK